MKTRRSSDARLVMWACLGVLTVIILGALFAPAREDNDPVPSTWNSGSRGAKVAYELLGQLGYTTARWDKPSADLGESDAAQTTLVLAQSGLSDTGKEQAGIAAFLNRGGRVIATGAMSALMLPEAHVGKPAHIYTALCYTTPESLSPLARAGQIAIPVPVSWKRSGGGTDDTRVDQACGEDAVIVHYPVGRGEVIWWSSAAPLSNRGLRDDANLRLLLASVGEPGRTVAFDEYIHGTREGFWDATRGTPVIALCWQLGTVALLLVLSFSRRNGPLRVLAPPARMSPLEFAESMGALYQKAGASDVATGAAERRLMTFLHHEGGIPHETLRSDPDTVAAAVTARFSYTAPSFASDLRSAREADFHGLRAKSALELVRRIDRHISSLTELMTNAKATQERRDE